MLINYIYAAFRAVQTFLLCIYISPTFFGIFNIYFFSSSKKTFLCVCASLLFLFVCLKYFTSIHFSSLQTEAYIKKLFLVKNMSTCSDFVIAPFKHGTFFFTPKTFKLIHIPGDREF